MAKGIANGLKTDLWKVDPADLTLIRDRNHPLYDERVELPFDEAVVLDMLRAGCRVPIKARKNGELLEVVDGRRRTINALEANRRLAEAGRDPIRVPVQLERGRDVDHVDAMIATNELRRPDSPVLKATKIQRYLNAGRTEDEAALTWGVSVATIKNWLKLLDLEPGVQVALAAGQLGLVEALDEYLPLTREEQAAKLEAAASAGELPAPAPNGKKKRKKKRKGSRPPAKLVREVAMRHAQKAVRQALLWSLGDMPAEEVEGAPGESLREAIDDLGGAR